MIAPGVIRATFAQDLLPTSPALCNSWTDIEAPLAILSAEAATRQSLKDRQPHAAADGPHFREPPPKLYGPPWSMPLASGRGITSARGNFSGAILVDKGNQTLSEGAYGFAGREARKLNELDTQFRSGSIGKMFAIVTKMQLVEDGKDRPNSPAKMHCACPRNGSHSKQSYRTVQGDRQNSLFI